MSKYKRLATVADLIAELQILPPETALESSSTIVIWFNKNDANGGAVSVEDADDWCEEDDDE